MSPHSTTLVAPPIFPRRLSSTWPSGLFASIAIQYSMFAPFKGLVGGASIVQRSGAGALQQVGEGAKGDGVGCFEHAPHRHFFWPKTKVNRRQP